MAKASTQTQLEGMQDPKIQEITDAAVAYSQTIRARLKLQGTEAEEKKELLDLMKAHKLEVLVTIEVLLLLALRLRRLLDLDAFELWPPRTGRTRDRPVLTKPDAPTEDHPMPERIVNHGETVVQALSFASSILLVLVHEHYECRGCILLAEDCTMSQRLPGPRAALEHLDAHIKAGHSGAKDAIWKMESCAPCRGAGRHFPPLATPILCSTCKGDGKNDQGKDRGVRRGVAVG